MTTSQKIRMALAYKNMKEAELARALGTFPQSLNRKMKSDKFTVQELERIAEALGATYVSEFQFPDGTKI